ncbi:MAG: CRISPR system precrRNA processing endoribonuclease RAMP protein Cas6 [Deltaproteobacteria bacterium]|nr:CRISPR system precrRNA processing endoribonuclease RAMP protein Cas6 [Deltaproteobacteria bacterium]
MTDSSPSAPGSLAFARVRCTAFAVGTVWSGPELAVHLRGALGLLLRQSVPATGAPVCPTPDAEPCTACTCDAPCLYRLAFDAPAAPDRVGYFGGSDAPRPYLVRTEPALRRVPPGGRFTFELTAFGPLAPHLPQLVDALRPAQYRGLGRRDAWFRLAEAHVLLPDGTVKAMPTHGDFAAGRDPPAIAQLLVPPPTDAAAPAGRVTVRFLTPTRIKARGDVTQVPALADLVDRIGQRVRALVERWGTPHGPVHWPYAQGRIVAVEGNWVQGARRSRSQAPHHQDLSGFVGDVAYEGNVAPLLPWLFWAEVVGVGSGIPFGCGVIEVLQAD